MTVVVNSGASEVVETGTGAVTEELETDTVVAGLFVGTDVTGTPLDVVIG